MKSQYNKSILQFLRNIRQHYFLICITQPKMTFLLPLLPYKRTDIEIGSCRQHDFFILLRWVRPWIAFDFKIKLKNKHFLLHSVNQVFAYKTQADQFWLNFLNNMSQPLAKKNTKKGQISIELIAALKNS